MRYKASNRKAGAQREPADLRLSCGTALPDLESFSGTGGGYNYSLVKERHLHMLCPSHAPYLSLAHTPFISLVLVQENFSARWIPVLLDPCPKASAVFIPPFFFTIVLLALKCLQHVCMWHAHLFTPPLYHTFK